MLRALKLKEHLFPLGKMDNFSSFKCGEWSLCVCTCAYTHTYKNIHSLGGITMYFPLENSIQTWDDCFYQLSAEQHGWKGCGEEICNVGFTNYTCLLNCVNEELSIVLPLSWLQSYKYSVEDCKSTGEFLTRWKTTNNEMKSNENPS